MVDLRKLRVPPGPQFAMGKKVAGPDEMQRIAAWARELQQTINTLQLAIIELQEKP